MKLFIVLSVFMLIAAAEGQSAQDSLHPSNLQWLPGAFWKMNGSQLFDESHFGSGALYQKVNEEEAIEMRRPRSASKEECYLSEDSTYFDDCQTLVEQKFDENRLPQVRQSVRCLHTGHNEPSGRSKCRRRSKCEEVKIMVPVLRKNTAGEGRDNYRVTFETTSVACVRTVTPSCIGRGSAHRVTLR